MNDSDYDLISAVREGNVEKVRELVDSYGLSHLPAWCDGYVLLCHALKKGSIEIAKLLLTYDCKVNSKPNIFSDTPLHYAVTEGGVELITMLLKKGAEVNFRSVDTDTPLHIAARNGHMQIVQMLVDAGSDINTEGRGGRTPFFEAVNGEHIQIVDYFLKRGASINIRAGYKITMLGHFYVSPLHLAIEKANEEIFILLLTNGADANIKINVGITPLHFAALKGLLKYAEYLLKYGAHVDSANEKGFTPLYMAVMLGHKDVAILLMENGADVNIQDETGKAVLHIASEKGFLEIIEHILKYCPDVNKECNRSALVAAVCSKGAQQGQIVESLLDYGFNIIAKDIGNHDLIWNAVGKGYIKIVRDLLKYGVDINLTLHTGWKLLHFATKMKQAKMAELLIKQGININLKNERGKTPLFYAVENDLEMFELLLADGVNKEDRDLLITADKKNCRETVELLLQYGADSNVPDEYGTTALYYTLTQNTMLTIINDDLTSVSDIIEVFLSHGANVNAPNRNGGTALHYAAEVGDAKVVEVFLKYNADVNCLTIYNETALHLSAGQGSEQICKMLLDKGADINTQTEDGNTPLHIASRRGHEKVVELLLKYVSDINIANKYNATALHLSAEQGNVLTCELLLNKGANVNAKTERGDTALHSASLYGHDQVVKLLLTYGADVNIANKYKGTALQSVFRLCIEKRTVIDVLRGHILKMINADLYVVRANLSYLGLQHSKTIDFQNECKKEIESMKEKVDNTTVSFRDILTDNVDYLVSYTGNENILRILESDEYEVKFPLYGSVIKSCIRKGLRRRELLGSGKESFYALIADMPELPDICVEKILRHLSDKDLKMLISLHC